MFENITVGCPGGPGTKRIEDETISTAESDHSVMVLPNPTAQQTTAYIEVQADERLVTVELLNVSGQQLQLLYTGPVKAGKAHGVPVNVEALSHGVYFIRTQTSSGGTVTKLVVAQ